MPGPKIDNPISDSAPSTSASASVMVGVPEKPVVNSLNRREPMPTITASTRILTPEATMLPRTFSARNAVLLNSANGISTKPASVVNLNSISVTNIWTARMKKAMSTIAQAIISTMICTKFSKNEM